MEKIKLTNLEVTEQENTFILRLDWSNDRHYQLDIPKNCGPKILLSRLYELICALRADDNLKDR